MRAIGYFSPAVDPELTVEAVRKAFTDFCRLNMHQAFMLLEPEKPKEEPQEPPPPPDVGRWEASGWQTGSQRSARVKPPKVYAITPDGGVRVGYGVQGTGHGVQQPAPSPVAGTTSAPGPTAASLGPHPLAQSGQRPLPQGEEGTAAWPAAGFRRLMEFIRQSGSEFLVVVPDARHLGPDLETVARSLAELADTGSPVACYDEEYPEPVQNAFQTLGIKGVSKTRSRKMKESMGARAMQGQALGRTPYGYRIGPDGSLEVVKKEAQVVQLIFKLFTKDNLGLRLIAQHLNEREIPTRRGGKWNVVTLRAILKNPTYTGTYTRYGVRRPKVHEAIIPHDTFRAALDQTSERRPVGRVAKSEPFMLAGILECGYCGNTMMGVTRRQSWKRKDGKRAESVYRYYQCQSRNNQSTCEYHTWRAQQLEGAVLVQLRLLLEAKAFNSTFKPEASVLKEREAQAARDARVKNAERGFIRAMKRVAKGEIGTGALSDYIKELDAARRGVSGGAPSDAKETLSRWSELDVESQRRFLSEHVAKVVVKDDAVEVVV